MTSEAEFWMTCSSCRHTWIVAYLPMDAMKFVRLLKRACPKCGEKKHIVIGKNAGQPDPIPSDISVSARAAMWIVGNDTGISSETIWGVMMGQRVAWEYHPVDGGDFGRCYRLLAAIPEWRERLSEMAALSQVWARMVGRWDDLTAIYLAEVPSGRAPKLYALMQDLCDVGAHTS